MSDCATVVNIKKTDVPYVYIGRTEGHEHFGNPFSHLQRSAATVRVRTLGQSVEEFRLWLKGKRPEVEPYRRIWVLRNMHLLRNQHLGCFCAPKPCHGDLYKRYVDGKYYIAVRKNKVYGPSKSLKKMQKRGRVYLLKTGERVPSK